MSEGELRRYGPEVIGVHWVYQILIWPLIITGWVQLRDWFLETFKIYKAFKLIPSYEWIPDVHLFAGTALLVVGLVHILIHARQAEKPMLPKDAGRDLKASMHNILHIFRLARWQERGASDKYKGNQRMTYVATLYCLSLSGLTAGFVLLGLGGETGNVLHIIAGVLFLFLSAYRILTLLKKRDRVVTRSILATGTVPEWYAKKNHYLWYRRTRGGYRPPPEIDFDDIARETSEEPEVVDA